MENRLLSYLPRVPDGSRLGRDLARHVDPQFRVWIVIFLPIELPRVLRYRSGRISVHESVYGSRYETCGYRNMAVILDH